MNSFTTPTVARHGSTDPAAPLVVLFHGRGSHELDIIGLAEHLPEGPAYVAVRAPIAEGGGFAWFANRGIGRPVAESLAATMHWFTTWLDGETGPDRSVLLIGFSGGAAFAGGLVLDQPERYMGAAIIAGTVPFDAGVPTTAGRLTGRQMFVAQGDLDDVIPRELLDRTWTYLRVDAGSTTTSLRDNVGHGISPAIMQGLAEWVRDALD
jgi:phospholipase/carboxylesterase